MNPLRSFLILSPAERALTLRSLVVVSAFRLGLTFTTYNKLRNHIPTPRKGYAPDDTLRLVARAVMRAARWVPRASCLTQALSAQYLLARSGYASEIRIGVAADQEARFKAHAWLLSDGKIVVGGSERQINAYTVLTDLGAGRS